MKWIAVDVRQVVPDVAWSDGVLELRHAIGGKATIVIGLCYLDGYASAVILARAIGLVVNDGVIRDSDHIALHLADGPNVVWHAAMVANGCNGCVDGGKSGSCQSCGGNKVLHFCCFVRDRGAMMREACG